MRRLPALAALGVLAIVPLGCGYSSYEARLDATKTREQDNMILDRTLYSPLQDEFAANDVYLRFPQGMAPLGRFEPVDPPAGLFDVATSFVPQGELSGGPYSLHVLARKEEEGPPPGEEGEEQRPAVARGDFRTDVLNTLAQVYGDDIRSAPTEQVSKTVRPQGGDSGSITFELMSGTDRNQQQLIQIYFQDDRSGNSSHDAALIWEFPSGQAPSGGSNPVDLTLGTFALGQRARAKFSGRPGGGGGGGGGAGVAF